MLKQRAVLLSLAALFCSLSAPVPAQASEVVKLARLVLTGKRSTPVETREPEPVDKAPSPAASQPADVSATAGGETETSPSAAASPRRTFLKAN